MTTPAIGRARAAWQRTPAAHRRTYVGLATSAGLIVAMITSEQVRSAIGMLVGLAVGFVRYFLPTWVASRRKMPNQWSIFTINLLLGWTVVGWIVALAMAGGNNEEHATPVAIVNQPPTAPPLAVQPSAAD